MKKNFFMLLAAAALVSCSTSEMNEPDAISGSLISLKSTTSTTDGTRAPFIGDVSATNPLTALVPSSQSGDYLDDLHAKGTMTFNNSNKNIASTYNVASLVKASGTPFPGGTAFPTIGNPEVNLFGLHPATGWTLGANSAEMTFKCNEDVMGSQQELVTLDAVSKFEYKTLVFNHLLTKLDVKFMAEAGAITDVGQIRLVEWIADGTDKLKNKVTFTPTIAPAKARASFAEATVPVTALSFYGATEPGGVRTYTDVAYENQTYVLTTAPTLQAYALVTPVSATEAKKDEYYIRVSRELSDGSPKVDVIAIDLMQADNINSFEEYTGGNAFSVVVNYTKNEIKAVGTVTPWIENGEYVANVTVN